MRALLTGASVVLFLVAFWAEAGPLELLVLAVLNLWGWLILLILWFIWLLFVTLRQGRHHLRNFLNWVPPMVALLCAGAVYWNVPFWITFHLTKQRLLDESATLAPGTSKHLGWVGPYKISRAERHLGNIRFIAGNALNHEVGLLFSEAKDFKPTPHERVEALGNGWYRYWRTEGKNEGEPNQTHTDPVSPSTDSESPNSGQNRSSEWTRPPPMSDP